MPLPVKVPFGVCPTANFCEFTAGQGSPACGSIPEHLVPLGLAEELCPRALVNFVANKRAEETGDFVLAEVRQELALGWYELELAMLPKFGPIKASEHFDAAYAYARRISTAHDVTFPIKMEADLLRLYLPTFVARKRGDRPSDARADYVREGLSSIYESLQAADPHNNKTHPNHLTDPDHEPCLSLESDRKALGAKLALFMLAARAGMVAYPASAERFTPTPKETCPANGMFSSFAVFTIASKFALVMPGCIFMKS